MKLAFILILNLVFGEVMFTENDVNRKRLDREIENRFNQADFRLSEIKEVSEIAGINDNGIFWRINASDDFIGYAYTGRVYSCGKNGCSADIRNTKNELAEFFDYFILYNSSKSVISIVVYNYEATHGQEITARGWLKQFLGYNGKTNLVVGKNIDSISGATVSVNNITHDIADKTAILNKLN